MHTLLAARMWPITTRIGFIHCPKDVAVDAWLRWQTPLQAVRDVQLIRRELSSRLPDVLKGLLPLTSVERRRFAFVPTASDWTAYFDNGHQGPDIFPPMSYLAEQIGCCAVGATDVPDEEEFPARILELWGKSATAGLNYIRSVAAAKDGSKWIFSAEGEVQPFEQPDRYTDRKISRRFTSEMLDDYLEAMGIRGKDEDFYAPNAATSTLIEKTGPIAAAASEFGLR